MDFKQSRKFRKFRGRTKFFGGFLLCELYYNFFYINQICESIGRFAALGGKKF